MEGVGWLRLGFVFALFVGSFWVLLPTFLLQDEVSGEIADAGGVDASADLGLEVRFDVEGDGAAAVGVLGARLREAGLLVDGVSVDKDQVLVAIKVGTNPEEVVRLASRTGKAELVSGLAFSGAPDPSAAPLPSDVSAAITAAGGDPLAYASLGQTAGLPAPSGVVPMAIPATWKREGTGVIVELGSAWPVGEPLLGVLIDKSLVGVVVPKAGQSVFVPLTSTGAGPDKDLPALLVGGALPAKLSQVVKAVEEGAEEAAVVATNSNIPAWLLAILPNTKMNLGIDLAGGIELTLRVQLDEAIAAQVNRDAANLTDRAGKEKVDLKAKKIRQNLVIESQLPVPEIQTFLRKWAPDYIFNSSVGTSHTFEMNPTTVAELQKNAVTQVIETIKKRVDATGVKEATTIRKGSDQIQVQLPGKVDLKQAIDALGTTAVLEFRLVDEDFDTSILDKHLAAAEKSLTKAQYNNDDLLNEWLWNTNRMERGKHMVLWEYTPDADGKGDTRTSAYVLKDQVILTGNDVASAFVAFDQMNQPYVRLEFKPRGGKIFCDVSTENVKKRFAIILDDKINSAPVIQQRICGGVASIEMNASIDPMGEANHLSLVLRTGSLDAPVTIGQIREVGATLGADAIFQASLATLLGSLFVWTFMLVWYGRAGFVANLALFLNGVLCMALLALFGASLTLTGIAGIALTIGMAVDANIIVYERIREELATGLIPRQAVDRGFESAFAAIFDSNVTTAMAGVVLFSYGTTQMKGFAVTLLVGIITTMVTALYVTRVFMDLITRSSSSKLSL